MTCKEQGCQGKVISRELCEKHYTRWRRNGTTESKYDRKGYAALGGVKDTQPGRRGYLSVNVVNDIKFKARKRGKHWGLSHEEAFKLITSPCNYCGFAPVWPESRVGIDRVDNAQGYVWENCVPCCPTCNSAKGELPLEEFLAWVRRVHAKIQG